MDHHSIKSNSQLSPVSGKLIHIAWLIKRGWMNLVLSMFLILYFPNSWKQWLLFLFWSKRGEITAYREFCCSWLSHSTSSARVSTAAMNSWMLLSSSRRGSCEQDELCRCSGWSNALVRVWSDFLTSVWSGMLCLFSKKWSKYLSFIFIWCYLSIIVVISQSFSNWAKVMILINIMRSTPNLC